MPKRSLTKTAVDRLQPEARDYVVWDAALPGFGVRVKPTGKKSYVVQYRDRISGASRRMTLGAVGPLISFAEARRNARIQLAEAMKGADPVAARKSARAAPTVETLCRDYIERHAIPNKRPKSVRDDRSMIRRLILPELGAKKVAAVTRRDLEALHLSMSDRPYAANRLLALLSKMFSLAAAWDWRLDNPAKGIRRFPEEKRDRWLSEAELERLWRALLDSPNRRASLSVQLQLLTGARLGEVLSARKDAFDLQRGVWTKPSHQTKQKRREHVPLSAAALAVVQSAIATLDEASPWLFPGEKPDDHLKDIKRFWSDLLARAGIEDYRRHDNRHTYASHLVSRGLSLEIVGRLLGHTSPQTTQRYAHLADDPLREATERFAEKLR